MSLDFLGGGVFKCKNWPPQPALAVVDDSSHPVTKNLPKEFVLPASEQNLLFVNALRWIVSRDPAGNPFDR